MALQAAMAPQQHYLTTSFSELLHGKGLIFLPFPPLLSENLYLQYPLVPFPLSLRLSDCNKLQWK